MGSPRPVGGKRGQVAGGLPKCSAFVCGACVFIQHRSDCTPPHDASLPASPAGRRPWPAAPSRGLEAPCPRTVHPGGNPAALWRVCPGRPSADPGPAVSAGTFQEPLHPLSRGAPAGRPPRPQSLPQPGPRECPGQCGPAFLCTCTKCVKLPCICCAERFKEFYEITFVF